MRTVHWPAPPRVPLQPRELAETGLCARHPNPELWTASRPPDRERAAAICSWCPVLAACREWSIHLPWSDNTVYAGLGARERRQARRSAQEPGPACPAA